MFITFLIINKAVNSLSIENKYYVWLADLVVFNGCIIIYISTELLKNAYIFEFFKANVFLEDLIQIQYIFEKQNNLESNYNKLVHYGF